MPKRADLILNARIHNSVPQLFVGDSVRLRQVLLNLVANALKFTERGSVTIEVRALDSHETEASEVELHFAVRDTGVGISADNQARIFDAFVQVAGAPAERGGTGLGLAIAARLVTLMGGALKVTSTPGTGSTFFFVVKFPRATREEVKVDEEASRDTLRRRLRVLVADDNAINRMVTERMLQRGGHTVALAENGLRRRWKCTGWLIRSRADGCPDARDGRPGGDGVAIRRAETTSRRTPIVGLTAHAFRGDRDRRLDAGMDDYVAKPVRREELEAAMARALRRSSTSTFSSSQPTSTAQQA